jgi:ketosteroid isomerase-like protein
VEERRGRSAEVWLSSLRRGGSAPHGSPARKERPVLTDESAAAPVPPSLGCKDAQHEGITMASTTPLEIIRSLYDALGRGDARSVLPLLDPDIEWTEAEGFPLAGTFHGPQEVIARVLVKLAEDWHDFQTLPEEFVDGGSDIVALGHYSGTNKATGRSFRAPFAHVWKVRDGKAVRYVQYTDTWLVHQALPTP